MQKKKKEKVVYNNKRVYVEFSCCANIHAASCDKAFLFTSLVCSRFIGTNQPLKMGVCGKAATHGQHSNLQ